MLLTTIFFLLSISVIMIVPFMKNPFSLGSAFMISLSMTSVFLLTVTPTWFGVTLFLVYVGALMVLFLYMCCLSPNNKIIGPRNAIIMMIFLVSILIVLMMNSNFAGLVLTQTTLDSGHSAWMMARNQTPKDLASYSGGDLLIISGGVIFISFVAVVKTCKQGGGPLRPFKRSTK